MNRPPLIRWWAVALLIYGVGIFATRVFYFQNAEAIEAPSAHHAEIEPPLPPKTQDRLWHSEADQE